MHALRFLHGDAYARNLLVTDAPAAEGPGSAGEWLSSTHGPADRPGGDPALRPLERDLGSLFLGAAEWMSPTTSGRSSAPTWTRASAADRSATWTPGSPRSAARALRSSAASKRGLDVSGTIAPPGELAGRRRHPPRGPGPVTPFSPPTRRRPSPGGGAGPGLSCRRRSGLPLVGPGPPPTDPPRQRCAPHPTSCRPRPVLIGRPGRSPEPRSDLRRVAPLARPRGRGRPRLPGPLSRRRQPLDQAPQGAGFARAMEMLPASSPISRWSWTVRCPPGRLGLRPRGDADLAAPLQAPKSLRFGGTVPAPALGFAVHEAEEAAARMHEKLMLAAGVMQAMGARIPRIFSSVAAGRWSSRPARPAGPRSAAARLLEGHGSRRR